MVRPCLFILLLLIIGCKDPVPSTLFRLIPGDDSGLDFTNELTETMEDNMLFFSNFYTGGGVGILDVNKDGLPDIFLGGNQVSSRLYLNKGNLRFEDITASAGVATDRWITGVSVVDINADGYDDIYLSVSGPRHSGKTENLLYINKQDNSFSEQAAAFGLAVPDQTTHASFFDYDRDGDLDVFMAINPTDFTLFYMGRNMKPRRQGEAISTDKLFQNQGNGTFREVSGETGILIEGYSLGVHTSDFNDDGWIDIYVTNDFVTNDILYMNNGDGTFTDQLGSRFDLTSYASMGNDAADINNDGHIDLLTLDMLPEDNYREKIIVPTTSYNAYHRTLSMGYYPQLTRNMLQLNNGDGTFSEIGQLAGVARTDWSWSSLFSDLNNDGYKDLLVTNGFRRELGNLDYIAYDEYSPFSNPGSELSMQINKINSTPGEPLSNYVFRNNGDLTFTNTVKEWGLELPSYSNGAAYADLDNDGDLDLVIHNIDQEVSLYENLSSEKDDSHYLKVQLSGNGSNTKAVGSRIFVFQDHEQQVLEVNPYRGYLSTVESTAHFGVGGATKIDSMKVQWPNGSISTYTNIPVDTLIVVKQADASKFSEQIKRTAPTMPLFQNVTQEAGIDFTHTENRQVDFHVQFLLPHQHSKLGPGIAVGDANGDGRDDFFIGGAAGQSGRLYLQNAQSRFEVSSQEFDPEYEDMGILFLDYDKDGDQDLYVASGGTFAYGQPHLFQDRLYKNDGKGRFTLIPEALPTMNTSSSSVSAADFDADGDLDLFIGGRIKPREYPTSPRSYLLLNEGGRFLDRTDELAAGLGTIGMVSQGLWTDFDQDNDTDLVLVGEWMPVTVFVNQEGKLVNRTEELGLANSTGWWNSITAIDQDLDGSLDYILGNLGANNDMNAAPEHPLRMWAKDFDANGAIDPILTKAYPEGRYPVASRDAFLGQLPGMRLQYNRYGIYGQTGEAELFPEPAFKDAQKFEVNELKNGLLINAPDGFRFDPLSNKAQLSPIFGTLAIDIDSDGRQECITSGNFFSSNVITGPYCSSTGALIRGGEPIRGHEIGLDLRGDRKAIALIQMADGTLAVLSSANSDALSIHRLVSEVKTLKVQDDEYKIRIKTNDGRVLQQEVSYGSGYISQNSRIIVLPAKWDKIELIDYQGNIRIVKDQLQ